MKTKFIDFLNENKKERVIDKKAKKATVDAIIKAIESNDYKLFLDLFKEYESYYSRRVKMTVYIDENEFDVGDIYDMINATCIYNRVDMFEYLNTIDKESDEMGLRDRISVSILWDVRVKMLAENNIKLTEFYLEYTQDSHQDLFMHALQYQDFAPQDDKKYPYKPSLSMIIYFFKNDYKFKNGYKFDDTIFEWLVDIYDTYRGGKKVFSDIENCIETAFDGDDSKIHSFLSNKYLSEDNLKLLLNKYFSQNFKDKYAFLFEFNYYTKSLTN